MYKIDNKNQKAKIKNLEERLDFQKYNIKEKKQKEKRKKKKKRKEKKPQELFKNTYNNHTKIIYDVCLKKIESFFFEK